MPIDRKALREKMKLSREKNVAAIKSLSYPLPDLSGPEGNAFALLAKASSLMSFCWH